MIKIHIGCGKRDFGPAWYHIDGQYYEHVKDNNIWLNRFEKGTVDVIYASHFIEYLDREKVRSLLKNWYNALKEGGILRLAVPDFEAMAKLYVTDPVKFPLDSLLGPLYGKMVMNEYFIYHKTCYDLASLSELLISVGFSVVQKYDWRCTEHAHIDDQSQAYLPKMDKEKGNLISLNVEAIK